MPAGICAKSLNGKCSHAYITCMFMYDGHFVSSSFSARAGASNCIGIFTGVLMALTAHIREWLHATFDIPQDGLHMDIRFLYFIKLSYKELGLGCREHA